MKMKRKTIKRCICYAELLGDISDIKDPEERLGKLMIFTDLLQDIVYRETKIETLKNLRKAFNLRNKDKHKYGWGVEINWDECPYINEHLGMAHIACNPKLDCEHIKSKTHRCTRKNCPLKV